MFPNSDRGGLISKFLTAVLWVLLLIVTSSAYAQTQVNSLPPPTSIPGSERPQPTPDGGEAGNKDQGSSSSEPADPGPMSIKKVFLNLPGDQKAIWTSPFRVKVRDLSWLAPLGTGTGLLITSDRRNMAREHSNPEAIKLSKHISDGGLLTLAGVPAGMYVWGSINGYHRSRETGLLTAEALGNSIIVDEALKSLLGRERPNAAAGQGRFFQQFGNPSFPSDHAMLSWSAASVIAHEYPGVVSQFLSYATASAVTLSRVSARKHFPSDVLAGSAVGWLIGRRVYRAHHDPELDEGEYGHFIPEGRRFEGPQTGSSYVPIDSWVYPLFDRLAALGYLDTGESGMRPWTRTECARLVEEIGQRIAPDSRNAWASAASIRLSSEFAPEIEAAETQPEVRFEDVYTRVGFISGDPLADDYHFAKTITDDFGRPFGSGANVITGISARSTAGPLAFYARAEYQHAGTLPAQGAAAQAAVASQDLAPFAPPQRTAALDRFRPIEAYASFNYHNNLISFGKQSLWWGPGADGPMLFSNNAEPLPMLRISRVTPIELPWLFRLIGAIRVELFWGQLDGQQFVSILDAAGNRAVVNAPLRPHPYIDGEKISFKPTRNLEFGFGVTTIFGGPGFPFTVHSLLRSYSISNTTPGAGNDPGDRRSAFDFSYRIPGLRSWLTLYSDSFTEDEFSPISFPRKSAFRNGIYMPRLPKLHQVDLRVEGIYTDIPHLGAGVSYFNTHYLSGYTNYGQILGNAIGREGRGINIWSTYHFIAGHSLQVHYRSQHVNPEFLRGGYLRDFDAKGTFLRKGSLMFMGTLKYEHWNFPLLSTVPKTDMSAGIQISFQPRHGLGLLHAH